jgi:DNA-binding CsgD family transcriptional regulator
VLFDAGRMSEAAEVAIDGIDVVETLGLAHRKGVWCRCDAATALLHLGRNADAMRLLDEAVALEPQGIDALRVDITRGMLLLRLGDLDRARAHLENARHAGARLLDGQLLGPLYAALVEVLASQGELDEAQSLAMEGRRKLSDEEPAVFSVPLFSAAASAAATPSSAGRHVEVDAVRAWVDLSERALGRSRAAAPMALASHAAATCELVEAEGRADAAGWRAVATQWEHLREPYREAQSRLRAAQSLLATGGDRRSAAEELRVARAMADRIGAQRVTRAVDDVARRARITLGRAAGHVDDDPYHLTSRERDVLTLVAEGLTDRAIGSRLFISHRTVERHVSNLLAKFDAGRRSELTAITHRMGLAARDESESG